jgi:hypothetical protein
MGARHVVALVSVCALVGACGGGSSNITVSSSPGRTTAPSLTTVPAQTTVPGQDLAGDRALANHAVLTASDLPAGWKAGPHKASTDGPNIDKLMSDCLQVSSALFSDSTVKADSPDFTSPDGTQVHNSVSIEATVAQIQTPFAVFTRPEMVGCLQKAMTAELNYTFSHNINGSPPPSDVTIGQATVEKQSFPTIGDGTVAYSVTIPMTADRQGSGRHLPRRREHRLALRDRDHPTARDDSCRACRRRLAAG